MVLFACSSIKTFVLGAQKNCLMEKGLLSTHKTVWWRIVIWPEIIRQGSHGQGKVSEK